jgi:hypothetical protein
MEERVLGNTCNLPRVFAMFWSPFSVVVDSVICVRDDSFISDYNVKMTSTKYDIVQDRNRFRFVLMSKV